MGRARHNCRSSSASSGCIAHSESDANPVRIRLGEGSYDSQSNRLNAPATVAGCCVAGRPGAWRMGLGIRLRIVPKAGGAANAPARLKLQDAFGGRICKRNEDVVTSPLKGGPARVDCISRGVSLSQRPAASRLDGSQ